MIQNYGDALLCHYGVKGMKWGKRSIVLKKNSEVSRISLRPNEPIDKNRKYVSLHDSDSKFWESKLVGPYKKAGYQYVYKYRYTTINDIKSPTKEETVRLFTEKYLKDDLFREKVKIGNDAFINRTGLTSIDTQTDFFRSLGYLQDSGKIFMDSVKDQGYNALVDVYGKNSGADLPLILLDPQKTIKVKSIETL